MIGQWLANALPLVGQWSSNGWPMVGSGCLLSSCTTYVFGVHAQASWYIVSMRHHFFNVICWLQPFHRCDARARKHNVMSCAAALCAGCRTALTDEEAKSWHHVDRACVDLETGVARVEDFDMDVLCYHKKNRWRFCYCKECKTTEIDKNKTKTRKN